VATLLREPGDRPPFSLSSDRTGTISSVPDLVSQFIAAGPALLALGAALLGAVLSSLDLNEPPTGRDKRKR